MPARLDRLAGREPPALLVEPDGEQRADDHEAGEGGKEDVVPAEGEQAADDHGGHDEHAQAVEQAGPGCATRSRQPAASHWNATAGA